MGKLFYSYRDGEVCMDGKESGFTARVKPKTSEPLSGIMFDMDRDVNEFFEYVSTVRGKKC